MASSNITAYIISYLNDDPLMRQARIQGLTLQLNEWNTKTDLLLNVVAMNYTDAEISTLPKYNVNIIPAAPMSCTVARHYCQTLFYQSSYRWGVFLDDDTLLYPHNSSYNMFAEMDTHIEDYCKIGAFYPHNPMTIGFNALYKNEPRYATHHIFAPLIGVKGSMTVVRNFALYGEEPVYNDTDFDMQEDLAFSINLRLAYKRIFTCSNIILKEVDHKASFFGSNAADTAEQNKLRIARAKAASKRLVAKYPDLLSETVKGVSVDQSVLKAKFAYGSKKEFIPKDGVYDNTLFDWDSVLKTPVSPQIIHNDAK